MVSGALPRMPSPAGEPVAPDGSGSRRWRGGLYLPSFVLAAVSAWLCWIGVRTLERSGRLGAELAAGRARLVAPAVVALVVLILLCERWWPAERREVFARGHVHDAAFFVVHVGAVVPLMTLLGVALAHLIGSHARWIGAPWAAWCPRWLLAVVTLVIMDGGNWLAHWAEHRITPLWRMHALHHSQEELSVLTSFRAHPLSHLPGFCLATVPVIALMGDRGLAPFLITSYVCFGTLPHANVPWSLGPLGRIVVSPAYHRLHHSVEDAEGCNLGIVLTVWDVLAGRARFPDRGAPTCRTGLAHRPVRIEQAAGDRWHPGLLVSQLAEPFRVPSGNRQNPHDGTGSAAPGSREPIPLGRVRTMGGGLPA